MKLKTFLIFILLFSSDTIFAQKNKNIRKASSRNIKKAASKSGSRNSIKKTTTTTTTTSEITQTTTESEINSGNCDSYYTRCMNKICSSDEFGKCVCYEDKTINNLTPSFIDIDGMKIKQGFETFEYAKKQCVYILDQCMEERRGITEKYKNLVQRDCLMLTKNHTEKPQGLSGDLQNLKSCMKNYCTAYVMEGYEDFSSPEYSLCFNETYSKFAMDVYCSNVIAKSSSPLALKQLFLDEMALNREKSCIAMKGTFSNDRKTCYVDIKYGINKEDIKKSKKVPVGSYFECSASAFDAKKNETRETRQKKLNQALSLTATALNTAGTVLSDIGGKADPIGSLIDLGIDATETVTDMAISAKNAIDNFKQAKENAANSDEDFNNYMMSALPIALQNAQSAQSTISSTVSSLKNAGENVKISKNLNSSLSQAGLNRNNVSIAKTGNNIEVTELSSKAQGFQKAGKILGYTAMGVQAAAQITDTVMTNKADKMQMEEEEKGIISYAEIDRESGTGTINNTLTEKGNCFLNNEWFASENENIIIMWK